MKNKILTRSLFTCLLLLTISLVSACKKKDPSVLKIFVRTASNELVQGAKVVIIGDVNSDPATMAYVDTLLTNGSGFAEFNLDEYYTGAGEDNTIAYFDVLIKKNDKEAHAYVRCRSHITTVETVFLPN